MIFPSALFLFIFLPLVLIGHWFAGVRLRNLFLLFASLVFYAWGEGTYVLVMMASIVGNYFFGRLLDTAFWQNKRKLLLTVMIALNLLPLLYFKYFGFLLDNFYLIFGINAQGSPPADIHLPIGISFFTFQAMSYLIDVYRKTSKPQESVISVGLYISLFPQLIAGPIVRYHDVAEQIKKRTQNLTLFASGVERFVYGLGKKMLIANPLGYIADLIFSLPAGELTMATAWLGILCYALQIYFDFSGYSDMAIGLGRMLGFRFLENFNFPYVSKSIREFWQRWHISLSSWFRDYLYIPLGGNRNGNITTIRNLFIVFLICGLWHGASWNFIIWGLLHGAFLALERGRWGRILASLPKLFQHGYTLLVVLSAWVFFRAETLDSSLSYLTAMYQWPATGSLHPQIAIQLDFEFYITLLLGLAIATPLYQWLSKQIITPLLVRSRASNMLLLSSMTGKAALLSSIYILVAMEIANGSYNPFIYFRF
ncbi:MAG: alginate O-acetyltransferase complex protein AlgI [Parvicella sp.]|jgi:alginate O-acetyltransferase complex protein AlgI